MLDPLTWLASNTRTVAITTASSGDNTIHTVTSGTRFAIYYIWIQAEGAVDVTFKSGATAISGALAFALNSEKEWGGYGLPILVGRATGENFVVNLGGAVQVNGLALIGEMTA